ncbi:MULTISPECIES: ABC transporter permease [Kocuria]|uniref:ABC transporter permease n=1 Tax=Kocuria TaxID=57493 RepID=UPI000D6452B3|nr:iron ABC transporter permease [Kocuria rosea]PWF87589.1 iron ABC transporter permease [Kocuria rosea]STX03828.1 Sulfate transport system permease protein CysW [Kocuria rosea]STX07338.1 Sulfate transport system permease protein CysW [Kocuria rosea]VEH41490.1 Sulfate transport system permease protein CysW [Kocuria rosea]
MVLVAVVVATPVLALVVDGLGSLGSAAPPRDLGRMVLTTLLLMLGVGAGTLVVGGGLAWLVTAFRFPLRDVLVWLLVLPLAMPAYILGFVFLSVFDVAGPVQGALRSVLGPDVWVPEVRSLPAAVLVMSLTLYPYVYLLARSALVEQTTGTYDAARTLGAGRGRALRRVLVPLARPSLAAGLALVMMETLTDFATVQYFNVQTVSVGVYLVWKGTFDFHSATQLAVLVLLFAVAVLTGERLLRGRARFHQRGGRGQGLQPQRLTGWRAWGATLLALAALSAGFLVPVLQLLVWAVGEAVGNPASLSDPRFAQYLGNSLVVAGIAAVACVALSLAVAHGVRMGGGRAVAFAAQLTTFGYAVPGAVVGIGVLIAFAGLDTALERAGVPGGTGLLVTGSVLGILYAYVIRFLAPAYQAVDASLAKISPTVTFSAQSLGASPLRVLTRVHLPIARPGVATALVLVMIDAVKELPIVLLLRPFGFTTASVWVYELARENFWEKAALPALVIVAAAVVPVFFLVRQAHRADRHGKVSS